MATHLVNLDALIRREDFAARTDNAAGKRRLGDELKLHDLEKTYFQLLRKPDFQRETCSWDSERIADFVKSFLDGDLIPAIIMWWSPNGTVFVIDGSHRLSALMAWVHDDYGAGTISQEFWGYTISPEQHRFADATKTILDQRIGTYNHLKHIAQNPDSSPNEDTLLRARNMATFKVDLQWVEGTAETAENSFFKINASASIMDKTEIAILKARKNPNAIATRALMHSGAGHKYWPTSDPVIQKAIETHAKDVYNILFKPILESPIKTLDLPIAGHGYSANAFKMILDLVNLINGVTPGMWNEGKPSRRRVANLDNVLKDDADGSVTVLYLEKVKKAAQLISGTYAGSLGLHPVVYFYSANGRFQPASFLAAIKFASELKSNNRFAEFTAARYDFEEFLVAHRHFVGALGHGYGSRTRPVDAIVGMYDSILKQIALGTTDHQSIAEALYAVPGLNALRTAADPVTLKRRRKAFSKDEKSAAFIRQAIEHPAICAICRSRLHLKSISTDHILRREDAGSGDASNAQSTHPYCNTGYKEHQTAIAKRTIS
jgi:hypothetical protein